MSTISVPDELARKLAAADFEDSPTPRRKPRLLGIGASDGGTSHRIDELLAEGFGKS